MRVGEVRLPVRPPIGLEPFRQDLHGVPDDPLKARLVQYRLVLRGVARDADRGVVTRIPSRCVVGWMTITDHVSGQRWDREEYFHDAGADRGDPHVRAFYIPTD
jgi:hypothetical protein